MAVSLNDLPIEPTGVQPDFDNYADPQEFAPPIAEGTYNFKTTRAEVEKFDQSTGVLSVVYDHEAYDKNTGQKAGVVNFDRVSTKVFNRNNIPVSMAADMLRAVGVTQRPSSPREWGEQLLAVKTFCDQGQFWSGVVKWDGYCSHKDTPFETQVDGFKKPLATQPEGHKPPTVLRGASKWPLAGANGAGHREPEVPCVVCGTPIQARAKLDRRVPK